MKFTYDDEMRKISNLAQEFFERVLYDEIMPEWCGQQR